MATVKDKNSAGHSRMARDQNEKDVPDKCNPTGPAFDSIQFHGVGTIIKRGRHKTLKVFNSEKEAIKMGIDPMQAKAMFAAGLFGPNNCVISFGWVFGVSCDGSDDCAPGKTCFLQYWDPSTKSWFDHGGTSAGIAGNKIWRCKCK